MPAGNPERLVSGMRPVGRLHLADYLGTLQSWLHLQQERECLFFVADWHALACMSWMRPWA